MHRASGFTFANMAQKGGQTADLTAWYADLNRCGQKQEYDKAIKIAGRSKWTHMPVRLLQFNLSVSTRLDYMYQYVWSCHCQWGPCHFVERLFDDDDLFKLLSNDYSSPCSRSVWATSFFIQKYITYELTLSLCRCHWDWEGVSIRVFVPWYII